MDMRKILIVDDEHDICDFVKNFFQERGYEVLTALNGDDALVITKEEKPELILLDVKMKGSMDELKKYADNPELVIGRFLTVKFQGWTKYGKPRFPVGMRFREDI